MARPRHSGWAHTRLLGGPWLAAAVVVPVVLAVVASVTGRAHTERELADRTRTALVAAGVRPESVDFDGVVGTVVVKLRDLPDGTSSRDLQALVDDVRGARSVTVRIPRRERPARPARLARGTPTAGPSSGLPAPSAPAADPCADLQAGVDAILGDDRVAFGSSGAVLPDDESAEVEQAGVLLARCSATVDVVGHTADRAVAGSTVGVERARAVAAVLRAQGVTVAHAVGRRDADPIGDNDTQAGRVLNRYAQVVVR